MHQGEQQRSLLVELDCLLDTRIAAINQIDPAVAAQLLEGRDYHTRQRDNFEKMTQGAITDTQFREAYAARNKETLKCARPTNIVRLLYEITQELEAQLITEKDFEGFQIEINIYPYELTYGECEAIKSAVMHYTSFSTNFEVVSVPPKHIDPPTIKKRWDGLILYDFDTWFTHHVETLNKVLLPRHLMFVPALYIKEDDEEFQEIADEIHSPFELLTYSMTERLKMNFLPPKEFSIIDLTT